MSVYKIPGVYKGEALYNGKAAYNAPSVYNIAQTRTDTQGWEPALPDDSMDKRPYDDVTYSASMLGVHTAEGVVSGVYDPTPGAPKEETVVYGAGVAFASDGATYDPRFDEAVNVEEATFSAQILDFEFVEVS